MGFISLTAARSVEEPENLLAVHKPEPPQNRRHFHRASHTRISPIPPTESGGEI